MRMLRSQPALRIAAAHFAAVALLAAAGSIGGLGTAAAWEMRVCADPDRMPFSSQDMGGLENKIAVLLADAMHAELTIEWFPQNKEMLTDNLRVGKCDIVMGVQDGQATLISTLAYYRSPYVFVQKAGRPFHVNMFDDPVLHTLKIGIQDSIGPTHDAVRSRGMGANIAEFYDFDLKEGVDAVIAGKVDVAILWGPAAGYYASLAPMPLEVLPIEPEFEPPFTPMFVNIAVGVRRGDEALREALDIAIAKQWDKIGAVLAEFHIPTMPLQHPLLTVEGR